MVVGGALVPGVLVKVAVVCSPVASRIENVSGLTQAPFVIAVNGRPLASTVGLTMMTAVGKLAVMRYGGVPP